MGINPGELGRLLAEGEGESAALALLSNVLATLPAAVGLYDASAEGYPVLYLNPATESFAGPVIEPYAGKTVLEVYPDAIQNQVLELLNRCRDTGEHQSRHAFVSHTNRVFNVDVYPIAGAGRQLILQAAQEVTDLARARQRLELGVDLALDLAARLDQREVLGRLLRRTGAAVGADRVTVSRVDGDEVVVEGSYDTAGDPLPAGSRWKIDSQPMLDKAVRTAEAVVGGPPSQEGMPEFLRPSLDRVKHQLTVPMVLNGEVVGIIACSRTFPRRFSDHDVAVGRQVATVAASALQSARLYQRAQEASRAKGEFMNMAAHELRTPLSVVNGYVSLLRDGSLGDPPGGWREPLDVISRKTEELALLVDDVLTAARLEAGTIPPGTEEIEISALAEAAVARAEARVSLLNATLESQVHKSPARVRVNPLHVARILDNLVNNALTYSRPPRWIRIALEPGDTSARVVVEDNGKGIPSEAQKSIFDQFVRIEDPSFGYPPGTGLGLYISRKLAQTYGGSLELEASGVGKGSRFVLTLPLVHEAGLHAPAGGGGA